MDDTKGRLNVTTKYSKMSVAGIGENMIIPIVMGTRTRYTAKIKSPYAEYIRKKMIPRLL